MTSPDVTITHHVKFVGVEVAGLTSAGINYVESIFVRDMDVLDCGVVVIPAPAVYNVEQEMRAKGLTFEVIA